MLADVIEKNPKIRYAIVVLDYGDYLKPHGYGDARSRRELAGMLTEAACLITQSERKR